MDRHAWSNPLWLLAAGVSGFLILLGLSFLLPPVIKAFGAAGGLATATAATGFATAGITASWLPTLATASMAAAAGGTTYLVVHRVVREGTKQPFEWLLPLFTILTGLMVDLTKDSLFGNNTQRALFVGATAGFLLGGGILMRNPRLTVRVIGFVLPFLPLAAVWFLAASRSERQSTIESLTSGGVLAGWGLLGSVALTVLVVGLAIALPRRGEQED